MTHHLTSLISAYGSWLVAALIILECIGIPLPGETILIAAAIYAGTTHELSIWPVMLSGVLGGIIGTLIAFWIGREFGYRLLLRYGTYLHLNTSRIKIGQYLFLRYGTKVVFFARFVAVLRSIVGLLAGAHYMPWRSFLIANVTGAVAWVGLYGLGAFRPCPHIEVYEDVDAARLRHWKSLRDRAGDAGCTRTLHFVVVNFISLQPAC